ncbi:hypothetical protein B0E53_02911 [Micromonospora sp. MH33]|nr:hypothetical protein B0E53_02911 [Micromonospora sp. MH33]
MDHGGLGARVTGAGIKPDRPEPVTLAPSPKRNQAPPRNSQPRPQPRPDPDRNHWKTDP